MINKLPKSTILSISMILLLTASSEATAQGLIGTKSSIFDSSFCKTWGCKFYGKEVLPSGVETYSYTAGGSDQGSSDPFGSNQLGFTVYRKKGLVESALVNLGGQDSNLTGTKGSIYAGLVKAFTGLKISDRQVIELESSCMAAHDANNRRLEKSISLNAKYRVTCSAEIAGSGWVWDMWLKSR